MIKSNWKKWREFMVKRFITPWGFPGFVFYFILVILIVGSFGLFSEIIIGLHKNQWSISSLIANASNTSIALIAASSVEFILIHKDSLDHPERKSDIQITGLSFLILGFLLWMLANYFICNVIGLIISLVGLILAYYFWWIANAGNNTLTTGASPLGQLGGPVINTGDPNAPGTSSAPKITGDTSEFITE